MSPTHNGVALGPGSPLLTPGGRKRQLGPSEADDQMALVELLLGRFWERGGERRLGLGLTQKHPELLLLYAINPNKGGGGSKASVGIAKAMGLLAGMPDLHWPIMRGPFASLYVEMKRPDGNLSREQIERINALRAQHNAVVVAHSVERASSAILAYAELPKGEPALHPSAAHGDMVFRAITTMQHTFHEHYGGIYGAP